MKFDITKLLSVLLVILIPFLILMGAARFLFTPAYPAFEYSRPGFPADKFGFDTNERIKWVTYAVNYLNNDQGIDYLGNLQDQSGLKIFNQNELQHMVDVKQVYQTALIVWYAIIGFSLAALVWFFFTKNWGLLRRTFNAGGWLTIGLMLSILIFLAISFDKLFEEFHRLFFSEGSWLFSESDTLIRLLPLELWRDGFIIVSVATLFLAGLLVFITRKHKSTNGKIERITPSAN